MTNNKLIEVIDVLPPGAVVLAAYPTEYLACVAARQRGLEYVLRVRPLHYEDVESYRTLKVGTNAS